MLLVRPAINTGASLRAVQEEPHGAVHCFVVSGTCHGGAGLRTLCRECAWCACMHTNLSPFCGVVLQCACGICTAAAIAAVHSLRYLCVQVCLCGRFSLQQLVFQHRCLCCADTLCMYRALSQLSAYRFVPGSSGKFRNSIVLLLLLSWRTIWADCGGERVWSVEGSGYQLNP
jgi:hypothetical protein